MAWIVSRDIDPPVKCKGKSFHAGQVIPCPAWAVAQVCFGGGCTTHLCVTHLERRNVQEEVA